MESEESARALIDILNPLSDHIDKVVFSDKCKTPLRRINKRYSNFDKIYISTQVIDYLSFSHDVDNTYDLILCDSFIKQFAMHDKHIVIGNIRNILSRNGRVVFREYFGKLNKLLTGYWKEIPIDLDEYFSSKKDREIFSKKLIKLQSYMNNVGFSYMSINDFRNDLERSHVSMLDVYDFSNKPFKVVIGGVNES